MRYSLRLTVFVVALLCLLPAAVALVAHMPPFGAHPLPYGDLLNAVATQQRHITNMVSAVNFDYRGFDTLGEEFMLVCAVTGTVVLLRGSRGERVNAAPEQLPGRPIEPRGDAEMAVSRVAAPLTVIFGLYIALHAMTTPGGGFQGGVIIATGLLLVFLGEGYGMWRAIAPSAAFDAMEGIGAGTYGLCGFASMLAGAPFLQNVLPLGRAGDVFSGGLMLIENAGVALAVAGGFTIILIEFLEETRSIPEKHA